MSGLEAAGLALAIIPICTTGIAEYDSALDKVKRFRQWQFQLPRCVRRLRRQRYELELSMRLLLSAVVPHGTLESMLSDPVGPAWRDQSLVAKLRNRHGRLYPVFEEAILDICKLMKRLVLYLGLSESENVCLDSTRLGKDE